MARMYRYVPPKPLMFSLSDKNSFELRERAAEYLKKNLNKKGAERGSEDQQGFGVLAETVIRHLLGLEDLELDKHPLSYDIELPAKVKVDVKCRGGEKPFQEEYLGSDGLPREAKHNLFARQVYDDRLDTDLYLMTHLEHPKAAVLPGTTRQKKWKFYICGWVSKKRAAKEGVYLPRGSLTERGMQGWFPYRGQEIEFYNKNLNGLDDIRDLLKINKKDVELDGKKSKSLNLTSVDAVRIVYDLVGRGLLNRSAIDFVKKQLGVKMTIKPFLHPNQYHHLLEWLRENRRITKTEVKRAKKILPGKDYEGI